MLAPEDYGLMGMASILTGYIEIFNEMGLGAAIIQKPDLNQKELSSIFWLSLGIGLLFSIFAFILSYPTAWIFNEPRVIPITKLISVLFVISALMVVPYNLLSKEIKFKEIGQIQLIGVVVASITTLTMAYKGFGVWSLVSGTIATRVSTMLSTAWVCKWRPSLHCRIDEAKPLLTFGLNIAGSRSLFYLFQKSDGLIVGKLFDAQFLGYYMLAKQCASIPIDKIVAIINQVAYPVFAKYQYDLPLSRDIYLKLTKYIMLATAPILLGGAFFADQFIMLLLGPKWLPATPVFRLLCLAQLIVALSVLSSTINTAQGRPQWSIWFNLASLLTMAPAFVASAQWGFDTVGIPWVTVYPAVCTMWTLFTLRKIEISILSYFRIVAPTILATLLILGASCVVSSMIGSFINLGTNHLIIMLIQQGVFCIVFYAIYVLILEKSTIQELRHNWRDREFINC